MTSITPASAHDWDDDDRYYGYDRYDRGYYGGRGHGYRDYRHGGKHRRYYRDHDRHYYREPRATIVLPLPPPPPFFFPRVVIGHRHHHGCGH